MLIKKFKRLVKEYRENNKKQISLLKELEWAHVYHDSIRGVNWLENQSLNIGRWAGNYTFFYVLNRVLMDFKPKSILEFGLGESTKFITSYLNNFLVDTNHFVIEQDSEWKDLYTQKNKLSKNCTIKVAPIDKKIIKGFEVNTYKDLEEIITSKFDLYIVDGPFGSPRFSRYDIVTLAKELKPKDEFIILVDDYHREGEKDTINELLKVFELNNLDTFFTSYSGNKSVAVIATKKYRHTTTL